MPYWTSFLSVSQGDRTNGSLASSNGIADGIDHLERKLALLLNASSKLISSLICKKKLVQQIGVSIADLNAVSTSSNSRLRDVHVLLDVLADFRYRHCSRQLINNGNRSQ